MHSPRPTTQYNLNQRTGFAKFALSVKFSP
jgi:hypothetical protein